MSDFRIEQVGNTEEANTIKQNQDCVIRVLGIGGGGCNSLQHMINQTINGVEFIAINTDSQALAKSTSPLKVQIGVKLTNGLGAGCDPNKGRKAAEESREDIKKLIQGSDMVFITAGMGGGTGTGATPIIAEIAKETGALTVAVVTKPFKFEGKRKMVNAESGITELSKHVDSLIVIENNNLLKNLGANISIINAFQAANDILLNAVRGITDSITDTGYINLDFADVVTVMRGRGHAVIGNGVGQGANFVQDAVDRAIHSPLIEHVDIKSAAGLLANIKVNPNFPIMKFEELCNAIQAYADEEADCKIGLYFDDTLTEDQASITILITGISATDPNVAAKKKFGIPTNERQSSVAQSVPPQSTTDFFGSIGAQTQNTTRTDSSVISGTINESPFSQQNSYAQSFTVPDSNTSFRNNATQTNEVAIDSFGRHLAKEQNDDLWDLPPILRSKSE